MGAEGGGGDSNIEDYPCKETLDKEGTKDGVNENVIEQYFYERMYSLRPLNYIFNEKILWQDIYNFKITRPNIHTNMALLSSGIGTRVRRSSRLPFGRSTGNDISGHYKCHYFIFSLFFFIFFLHRLLFS